MGATGYGEYGQLGDGSTTTRHSFEKVIPTMPGVAKLGLGSFHTMLAKQDGSLWATGRNDKGQLGDGSTTDKHSFMNVTASTATTTIATTTTTIAVVTVKP